MRLALLLAAGLLLAGCTTAVRDNVARTVAEPPPPTFYRDGKERPQPCIVAPVYADDRALVLLACERAARAYIGHIDVEDAQAGTLTIHEHNGWMGDTDLEVQLVAVAAGTRVDAVATHRYEVARSREASVLERYLARVDAELRAMRDLRSAIAQPTAAGTPDDVGARGASATSRP